MDQLQSTFISKFPLEIRQLIYTELLGGASIHLHTKFRGVFARRCASATCTHIWLLRAHEEKLGFSPNILRTCHKIYSEAIELLYSENAFFISTVLDHQFMLLELPKLFETQRLFQIRSLSIHWDLLRFDHFKVDRQATPLSTTWFISWELLSRMTGLRKLHVDLVLFDFSPAICEKWAEVEQDMFQPIMKMSAPKDFVIILPSRSCSTVLDTGCSTCKFQLPAKPED